MSQTEIIKKIKNTILINNIQIIPDTHFLRLFLHTSEHNQYAGPYWQNNVNSWEIGNIS